MTRIELISRAIIYSAIAGVPAEKRFELLKGLGYTDDEIHEASIKAAADFCEQDIKDFENRHSDRTL